MPLTQYLYPAGAEGYVNDADASRARILSRCFSRRGRWLPTPWRRSFAATPMRAPFARVIPSASPNNPRDAWNRKYLLTAVTLQADQVPPYRTSDTRQGSGYSNRFTAVSSDIVFKPALTFMKPRIYGPQTALVVGPSGEEIYLDALGRAKVQFFWDKQNPRKSTVDTTWVRVAQSWAGNGWGAYFWPRVNDEVVIQFLNGDPDNPVITGSVYNGVNTPKYALPDNSTRSGLVTRSSKGGSAQNANELRFEDKMGSEQVYLHAEKDMDASIEHDRRISVGNNDSLMVTGKQTEQIGANYNRQVKANSVEQIGSNSDLGIGANLTEQVGGNHSLNVSSNQSDTSGFGLFHGCRQHGLYQWGHDVW